MEIIDSFKGQYRFLSNFYQVVIFHNGIPFPTLEHAFVASKSDDPRIWHEVYTIPTPGKVKRFGRKIQLIDNWDDIKDEVMRQLLIVKFSYPDLALKLLNTQNAELIEGNTWHDQYWGNCTCDRHINISGKNMLGQLLMEVREKIRYDRSEKN